MNIKLFNRKYPKAQATAELALMGAVVVMLLGKWLGAIIQVA